MISRTRRLGLLGLPALLLAAVGCGSSGPATGRISVHLIDAPADFKEIDLHIVALEAHSNTTGWVRLSTPNITTDLLKLTGGVVETLASGKELEAGMYTQFRLVLGPGQEDADGNKISNLVVLKDGSVHDLTVPSGLQTGVKLVCHVDVQPGANVDVFIDFVAPRSIFLHGTGLPEKFIPRPVVRCLPGPGVTPPEPPPPETGLITGQLTANPFESLIPLVGVTVTAQVLDTAGRASIVASTTTADGSDPLIPAGSYTLDNLPLPATYYVVSQPVMTIGADTLSWGARARLGLALDTAHPTDSFNDLSPPTAMTGNVAGTIVTATPNSADVVNVRQLLHPALNPITVIVRTAAVQVSGASETFSVSFLPVDSLLGTEYSLDASRPGGVSSNSVSVTVTTGAPVPATLTFP